MKLSPLRSGAFALLSLALALPLSMAQKNSKSPETPLATLRGEAFFLERIALPPGARLHVSLVGRIAGAEYLPLATRVLPARNGSTPFVLSAPKRLLPPGPYRLQAWIVADNRLFMQGRDAQTEVKSLDKPVKIRLKIVAAPLNIDGFGDGRPLPGATFPGDVPLPGGPPQNIDGIGDGKPLPPQKMKLRGRVSKLDRRALLPDSRLEIQLRDVSRADAPSQLIVGQVIQLEGGQLPKSFELELAPDDLQPRRRYALSARVLEAGKLTYITGTSNPVAPDDSAKNFELRVVAVTPTP